MDIYIKLTKKAALANRDKVLLEDVAEIFAPKKIAEEAKKLKLLTVKRDEKNSFIITSIDVVRAIDAAFPNNTVQNLGEIETLVDYKPKKSEDNRAVKVMKVVFISLVIFMGASTAIMAFHTDASIPKVFQNYYYLFLGKRSDTPLIIYLPYSMGLAAGIIVFFNHIVGKKITDDPTPIEVEISAYEKTVTDTKLDELNTFRIRNEDKK